MKMDLTENYGNYDIIKCTEVKQNVIGKGILTINIAVFRQILIWGEVCILSRC